MIFSKKPKKVAKHWEIGGSLYKEYFLEAKVSIPRVRQILQKTNQICRVV